MNVDVAHRATTAFVSRLSVFPFALVSESCVVHGSLHAPGKAKGRKVGFTLCFAPGEKQSDAISSTLPLSQS